MPLYSLPEPNKDRASLDEQRASLRIAIDYLRKEAARLGFSRVVLALDRAIVALDKARAGPPSGEL